MRFMRLLTKLIKRHQRAQRRKTEKTAADYLDRNPVLKAIITEAKHISNAYGLTDFEFVRLHQMVTTLKPEYVLECGTGKSTFVIAHAMSVNGNGAKLVSMEESSDWANVQQQAIAHFFSHPKSAEWFPGRSADLVELVVSDIETRRHRIWAGSAYTNIPRHPYSFIMVDGPELTEECFANIDVVTVLKASKGPLSIWIDGRWPTVAMCRALFGDKLVSRPGWTHTEIHAAAPTDLDRPMKQVRKEMHKMVVGSQYV
jgi:hypothetical protein